MSDAPVMTMTIVDDYEGADDFTRKHTPFVEVMNLGDGKYSVIVTVGKDIAHPNQPDHWIEYLEVFANGAPIATYDFAAGVVAPKVMCVATLEPGTPITVFERCNLHGVWAADATA